MIACTKCKKEYPETPEYFFRDKTHKNGLGTRCKTCVSKANSKYQKENKEKAKVWKDKWNSNNREWLTNYARMWRKRPHVKLKAILDKERKQRERKRLGL